MLNLVKKGSITALTLFLTTLFVGCGNNDDDGPIAVPIRDRAEEALEAQTEIEEFLSTHFYNYEEFENPPADFDYKIKIDSIAGENLDKTPLIEQVQFKTVKDRVEDDVTYKLYYLKVSEGGGTPVLFPDILTLTYEGRLSDLSLFDGRTAPVQFDLTQIVNGLQDALIEFNNAAGITELPDGTLNVEDPGIGAVFIPSGLGYFFEPPPMSGIGLYAQLIFTFQTYTSVEGDQDNDGVPSIIEDLNGNGIEEDDDTDEDGVFNLYDNDDDNDGRLTRDEIEIDDKGHITYPDSDGDGTPDYLDADS